MPHKCSTLFPASQSLTDAVISLCLYVVCRLAGLLNKAEGARVFPILPFL